MKRPTAASLKKVTPENLAALGAERLAVLLAAAAETRPELKRRLRMELAAEQGSDHLLAEIDKRLGSLELSRSKVSWRQRPTFVRDLDGLRTLIAGRLAGLDAPAALDRMWRFMDLARRLGARVRDRDGELAAVFVRAAGDVGALLRRSGEAEPRAEDGAEGVGAHEIGALVEAVTRNPAHWAGWLPATLEAAPPGAARLALLGLSERPGAVAAWTAPLRRMADAAGDVDAYRATFTSAALRTPQPAADVAGRLLAAGRLEEAGAVLEAARPPARQAPDYAWETGWIDWLEASGQAEAAQAARWASFERTLSPERLRAFTRRLADFEDVEAEGRAFAYAAGHRDFERGLRFLLDWPALPEAARMVETRGEGSALAGPEAEAWAERLRARQPGAARILLRTAAQAASRRKDQAASARLTAEADAL